MMSATKELTIQITVHRSSGWIALFLALQQQGDFPLAQVFAQHYFCTKGYSQDTVDLATVFQSRKDPQAELKLVLFDSYWNDEHRLDLQIYNQPNLNRDFPDKLFLKSLLHLE